MEDAEEYEKLSPVEWEYSEEESFAKLNLFLSSARKPFKEAGNSYKDWVSIIFDAFIHSLSDLALRKELGDSLYLTFAGVDPNKELESAERQFVEAMNSNDIFEKWCLEFD